MSNKHPHYYRFNWRDAVLVKPLHVFSGRKMLPIGTQIEIAVVDAPPEADCLDEEDGFYPYVYHYAEGDSTSMGVISSGDFNLKF